MCIGRSVSFFKLALSCCVAIATARAQLTEATLKGAITDATGVVARASVVAKNDRTGLTRSAVSDAEGAFIIPALSPGIYTVNVQAPGFKTFEQKTLELNVGKTAEINVRLELGDLEQTIEVTGQEAKVPVSTEARLSDTLQNRQVTDLPLSQRDVFGLPRLSAGATLIPGTAFSFKLSSSPTIMVNGNRSRGNNYVLDGSMNSNSINSGEPAIVPSLESVEEVQVQTGNFSSEFGRGNGAVVNVRTKSGTNDLQGRAWEYHKNVAPNARNFFAAAKSPLVFNQFGANVGGKIIKNRTFFFGAYEGSRNSLGQALSYQVETPEFRNYVIETAPSSLAASLLKQYPARTPSPGSGVQKYRGQVDLTTPERGVIPAVGTAALILNDYLRFDQYLTRIDHSFNDGKDTLTGRWISEYQRSNGATSSSVATLAQAMRGFRDPFDGFFGNLNVGEVHVFDHMVNDARFSFQINDIGYDRPLADHPVINVTGISAPFGDPNASGSRIRTYEFRDTLSFNRGKHLLRTGVELRRLFMGVYIGPPKMGTYNFNNLLDFAADRPYQQVQNVNPASGAPTRIDHYYTFHESGLFLQDDWKATSRLTLNLGVRHDYFGTGPERNGLLSSVIWGSGDSFRERLANASVGIVPSLYTPQKFNFSPRIGVAYDPFGNGKSSIRAGYSIAYQPIHGYTVYGASANSPYAIQALLQPNVGIGSSILYGVPVPTNSEFKTALNPRGGVQSVPGKPAIRISPWIVNPDLKTQYSESWFFNVQHEVAQGWIVEFGYVGTSGINLERRDDINRYSGDLLDGVLDRINPNFGPMIYVTNGVTSSYNGMTAEVRHRLGRSLTLQANYRWSKWLDTASDTSTTMFTDNPEPSKGAGNIDCLRCERARSLFDIPHRFTASILWTPRPSQTNGFVNLLARNWQISTILAAQSGRPFSIWCGASFQAGCDYNADGGGAIGNGHYDRPNAPAAGSIKNSFDRQDFLNGLFDPNVFSKPAAGTTGTLGRNTFRGPRQVNADVALLRGFQFRESSELQFRFEAFNVLNNVNLYLPNTDLSLALRPGGTFSSTSSFGRSTQAFDPRILQISARIIF